MLRAETAATSLKSAGEQISDSLLIAMIIKGLPSEEYKPFSTVMTQKDKDLSFGEFKVSLRSFEATQKLSTESDKQDSVMHVAGKPSNRSKKEIICYGCKKPGHKISECRAKKRWCEVCKNQTHDTEKCRKKKHANDATKTVRNSEEKDDSRQNENHSFIFKIGVDLDNVDCVNGLLVDCGATTHIVHDISKFTRFDEQFNPEHHYIELADGSRSSNVALKRGDANVELCDGHGNVQTALLKNALYVPSYKQDIFSVQAATSRGATVYCQGRFQVCPCLCG